MVDDFYLLGVLPRGINSSFITLIPKVVGSNDLKDFILISFIGILYKVILKVLVIRLKSVMLEIISDCSNVFIKGKQILDSALIVNKIINRLSRKKLKGFLFKLDFHKAFNSMI
jgi:hypothetical protein